MVSIALLAQPLPSASSGVDWLLVFVGCVILGLIYAIVVFDAVPTTPEIRDVQHNSAR